MSSNTNLLLCQLADIPDGGSKEFFPSGVPIFAVRQGQNIKVYHNSCPHTGMPLNWRPDKFFDVDGKHIQCSIHAAIFEPQTGLCVAGPCSGDSLDEVASDVRDGAIYIEQPEPLS